MCDDDDDDDSPSPTCLLTRVLRVQWRVKALVKQRTLSRNENLALFDSRHGFKVQPNVVTGFQIKSELYLLSNLALSVGCLFQQMAKQRLFHYHHILRALNQCCVSLFCHCFCLSSLKDSNSIQLTLFSLHSCLL
ncbi:uncharacterized [Tachysurus ichikawai]